MVPQTKSKIKRFTVPHPMDDTPPFNPFVEADFMRIKGAAARVMKAAERGGASEEDVREVAHLLLNRVGAIVEREHRRRYHVARATSGAHVAKEKSSARAIEIRRINSLLRQQTPGTRITAKMLSNAWMKLHHTKSPSAKTIRNALKRVSNPPKA